MDNSKRVILCVDRGLELIGATVKEVVYFHFENSTGIRKEEIPYRISEFTRFLENIFGPAVSTIEELILKELKKEFDIQASDLEEALDLILRSPS